MKHIYIFFLLLGFLCFGIANNSFAMKRKRDDLEFKAGEGKRRKVKLGQHLQELYDAIKNFDDNSQELSKKDSVFELGIKRYFVLEYIGTFCKEIKEGNFKNIRKNSLNIIQELQNYFLFLDGEVNFDSENKPFWERFCWVAFSLKKILRSYLFYAFYNGLRNDIQDICQRVETVNDICVSYQLEKGSEAQGDYLYSPLHWAVAQEDFQLFKFLVEQVNIDIDALDYANRTPIYLFVGWCRFDQQIHFQILDYFITHNADLNIASSIGYTLLHECISKVLNNMFYGPIGEDLLRVLILGGANIYEKSEQKLAPINCVEDNYKKSKMIVYYQLYKISECVKQNKFDFINEDGSNLLHFFMKVLIIYLKISFDELYNTIIKIGGYKKENLKVIDWLIRRFYRDMDSVFRFSKTVLQELLNKTGTKLCVSNWNGIHPIHLLGGFTRTMNINLERVMRSIELKKMLVTHIKECIDMLFKHGVPVEQEDKLKKTVLHWSARGHDEVERDEQSRSFYDGITRYLIERYNADVHKKDKNGNTALHYASSCAKLPAVRALVEHGADIDVENNKKESPYSLSRKVKKSKEKKVAEYFDYIKSVNRKFEIFKQQARERKEKQESLFTGKYKKHGFENCTICLEEFDQNKKPMYLYPCGHNFHEDCFKKHVIAKAKFICALCKQKVTQLEFEN